MSMLMGTTNTPFAAAGDNPGSDASTNAASFVSARGDDLAAHSGESMVQSSEEGGYSEDFDSSAAFTETTSPHPTTRALLESPRTAVTLLVVMCLVVSAVCHK